MPARWVFRAAFGINCMQLRQWCDAAHVKSAWNTCGAMTYTTVVSAYIALQQQETRLEPPGIVGPFKGDDSMAYAPLALALRGIALPKSPARKGPGFFALLLAAMAESRQRQTDREIARYLASTGGKFTDETEREIERRFLSVPSQW
jgi:hypothetical protein